MARLASSICQQLDSMMNLHLLFLFIAANQRSFHQVVFATNPVVFLAKTFHHVPERRAPFLAPLSTAARRLPVLEHASSTGRPSRAESYRHRPCRHRALHRHHRAHGLALEPRDLLQHVLAALPHHGLAGAAAAGGVG